MISTILTSAHIFTAVTLIPFGLLLVLGSPKNRAVLATGWIVTVYGISSIAFGLALNSVTAANVSIWIVALLITTYPVAPAAVMVSMYTLRPKLFSRWYVFLPLGILVFLPTVLFLMDTFGLSATIFGQNILLELSSLNQIYTGGYLDADYVLTSGGDQILRLMLILFYSLNIIFGVIVAIQERKKDKFIRNSALGIVIAGTLSTIASVVFQDMLPITLSPLISNVLIAISYLVLGVNLLAKEKGTENSWIQNVIGDLNMFYKMLLGFGLVLIPAIAFLSYSSFSFFQTSLITSTQDNLKLNLRRESELITEKFVTDLGEVVDLGNANRVSLLLRDSITRNVGLDQQTIERSIQQADARWAENDLLLTSVTMDPVKNVELRNLVLQNPSLSRLILVDPYGGLITASQKPEKYSYTFDNWFITLKENQDMQTFVGHAGWNESFETYSAVIAVSLKDLEGNFAGAILINYDLVPILNSFTEDNVQQVGYGLATPHGEVFPASGKFEDTKEFPVEALTPLPVDKSWRTFEFADKSHLIQTEPIANAELGFVSPWFVVAFQPVERAVAPLEVRAKYNSGHRCIAVTHQCRYRHCFYTEHYRSPQPAAYCGRTDPTGCARRCRQDYHPG